MSKNLRVNSRGASVIELALIVASSAFVLMLSLPQLVDNEYFFVVDFNASAAGAEGAAKAQPGGTSPAPGFGSDPRSGGGAAQGRGGSGGGPDGPAVTGTQVAWNPGLGGSEEPTPGNENATWNVHGGGTDEALQHGPPAPPIQSPWQTSSGDSFHRNPKDDGESIMQLVGDHVEQGAARVFY
ncbi:MAG: hypothetical protein KDD66_02880 [Bdellovibrionales bacterium]|nr:hypothetical protein [Bdellovibrionales bacterium]